MNEVFAARLIVTAIAAGQGIMPVFIDLNRTHSTNPLWPGHARFHVVWQAFTALPAAAIEIGLLWWPGPGSRGRFYVAALFAATSLAGFLTATLARPLYRGTLHDPNGIQPLRVHIGGRETALDMNVALVIVAAVLLGAAVMVFGTH
jgi:hypothetical protein